MANERLYQFPSKATPVPADIIYAGDSAAAFDEVNITISALIGAYPNLLSIGGLSLSANTFIYVNNSSTFTAGVFTALAATLVADSTVSAMQGTLGYTATPTASLFAGWDANSNLSANNFNTGYATTVTAGATTTLTVASAQQQYFTGSSNQTVAMPVVTTLVLGQSWLFVNLSTGTITINSSGGNAITTLGANSSTRVTCILTTGTTAASWSAATPVAGSGVVNSGTINTLAYYAATGSTVSGLATTASSVLTANASGVLTWVAYTGTGAPVLANTPSLITPSLGAATATSINFGGTSLSNYVEGTFTPTLTGSGANPTSITYSSNVGKYTRIGNIVHWTVNINVSALTIGSASGSLQISGLPIAAGATVTSMGSCAVGAVTFVGSFLTPAIVAGASVINLYQTISTLNIGVLAITGISSTTVIDASGFYFTS